MGWVRILWWAMSFAWILAGCSSEPDASDPCPAGASRGADGACPGPCDLLACVHGSCDPASELCVCSRGYTGALCDTCDTGFQDHDGDGTCLPGCEAAGLTCLAGSCDDSSGIARCLCPTGYGGADCTGCADGFQDHDEDGVCRPDCRTADLQCGDRGRCTDVSGEAACVCRPGHEGPSCSVCSEGFQDHDGDGICLPDCESAAPACNHGRCDDSSGLVRCSCDEGYTGASCRECSQGYQDNTGDGLCRVACGGPGGPVCVNGVCEDASGGASCSCEEGYAGASCEQCAEGYRVHEDGLCRPACVPGSCGAEGSCDDSGGFPVCACSEGHTGAGCEQCAQGYQDMDRDGVCRPACRFGPGGTCEEGVFCSARSGEARCIDHPRTCRDIQEDSAFPTDGDELLYPWPGDPYSFLMVFCADMDGEPKEYLDLTRGRRNYGEYVLFDEVGWMQTSYRSVRFDPLTFRIKVDDPRFTHNWSHEMEGFTPLGTAVSCDTRHDAYATIDLVGTAFRLVDTYFCPVGEDPRGEVEIRPDRQWVELRAGGSEGRCSGIVPSLDPSCTDPLGSDGWDIQLEYAP